MRDEVINWIDGAKADFRHAEKSIEIGDYSWACFAAHQAAEKALKALIMHVFGEYARGHDLVRLYRRVRQFLELKINVNLLARLSAYYTQSRYPNAGIERPHEEITEEQAKEAVGIAGEVINEVTRIIGNP